MRVRIVVDHPTLGDVEVTRESLTPMSMLNDEERRRVSRVIDQAIAQIRLAYGIEEQA